MAQIAIRLFNYIPDHYVLLGGEEWLRPLGRLGDWNRIRLGCLVAIRPNSTASIYNATFTVGLTSGRYGTTSGHIADNAIGMCLCGNPTPPNLRNWSYNANSGYPYYDVNQTGQFFHRYTNPVTNAQTYVLAASSSNNFGIPVAGIGYRKRRYPFVLDIQRTGSLYSFRMHFPGNSATILAQDWDAGKLMDAVMQTSATIITDNDTWSSSANSLQASEINGAFDTFSIYWSRATYPLELYAACACLLSDNNTPQSTYNPFTPGGYDYYTGAPVGNAAGVNSGKGWVSGYSFQGTSNSTPAFGMAGTSTGLDDPFEQYASGTALSLALAAGTNWPTGFVIAGTYPNLNPITGIGTQFYGTTVGMDDQFDQYTNGTVLTGATYYGTNWNSALLIAGTYPNLSPITGIGTQFYGTTVGMDDQFDQYATGTVLTGVMNGGTNWGGAFLIAGTYPNLVPYTGTAFYGTQVFPSDTFETYQVGSIAVMANGSNWGGNFNALWYAGTTYGNTSAQLDMGGTSVGSPWDSMEQYSLGTITQLNQGTGWGSYGTFFSY
jgi:hypothetical protein